MVRPTTALRLRQDEQSSKRSSPRSSCRRHSVLVTRKWLLVRRKSSRSPARGLLVWTINAGRFSKRIRPQRRASYRRIITRVSGRAHATGEILANELRQGVDIGHSPKSVATREDNRSSDGLAFEWAITDQWLQLPHFLNGESGHQRIAGACRDEVAQRLETRGMKLTNAASAICRTNVQGLILQTVSILEQKHMLAIEITPVQTFL